MNSRHFDSGVDSKFFKGYSYNELIPIAEITTQAATISADNLNKVIKSAIPPNKETFAKMKGKTKKEESPFKGYL